ncbi:hypothetical protein FOL47_008795 [Perkinsus chesapeaki]|uniref:Uncharacterized protein n=1 Tax=Perkinsus chesapeaki TaxID=330153 RepID=A0A7J6LC36_PERCH|nr:hypothetical protein FOL47_008795 [Perkinsus chesapeaki]
MSTGNIPSPTKRFQSLIHAAQSLRRQSAGDAFASVVLRKSLYERKITRRGTRDFSAIQRRTSYGNISVVDDDNVKEEALPDDMYYRIEGNKDLQIPINKDNNIPNHLINNERTFGFDFNNRYNILFLPDGDRFAYVTGQYVNIYTLSTGNQISIPSIDNGGIGALAIHHNGYYISIGEKCWHRKPNVYIYDIKNDFHTGDAYPAALSRVLRGGADRGYASIDFSPHDTRQLCTLGCSPDYMLSIWDWHSEKVLLRCKAFGQEVIKCVWGRFPGTLITYGIGHIRFWKMAKTFTGLKLQGDIGKFGQAELSDIEAYIQLSDGKVVTGSEYGKLLLWEGVFVKCEMVRKLDDSSTIPCHNGPIGVVFISDIITLDGGATTTTAVVTGGYDGYIRWWSLNDIDKAETPDIEEGAAGGGGGGVLDVGITLLKGYKLSTKDGNTAIIQHIERSKDDRKWLIQDPSNGIIWLLYKDNDTTIEVKEVLRAPSRALKGVLLLPKTSIAITGGMDGILRAYNITKDTPNMGELYNYKSIYNDGSGVQRITVLNMICGNYGSIIIVGYEDGTIRAFTLTKDGGGFTLIKCYKPHCKGSVDYILINSKKSGNAW